jgi:outer membrane receptor for ferrienterochelin and colicins
VYRLSSFFFIFCTLCGVAQQVHTGKLSGRVVDESSAPVSNAAIRIEPSSRVAQSDVNGGFQFPDIPLGKVVLTVTASGFFSGAKVTVDLTAQPEADVEIVLKRAGVFEQSVVVTGSGRQDLLVEAPVRTELISHEFVEKQVARNLSEALVANVPSLRVENNCQNCGWTAIRLNGMEGPYTQLLEDGLPTVSGASMVYALDQLPTEFYENIEVVKGGASSLYGPNAVAGVINMVRREPQSNHFQVELAQGYYKGRPEQTAGATGQIGDLWRGWAADFYYRGYRRTQVDLDGDGFTELTRRSSNAGGGTLFRRLLNGSARLTIGGSTLNDFRRGGSQIDLPPKDTYITEQIQSDRSAGFVRWNHTVNPSFYYNLSSSFSHLRRHSYYGAGFDPNAYGSTRNPLSASDASGAYQAGRHTLSFGTQYWYEHIDDIYLGYQRDTRLTFRNAGMYLQDEWRLSPRVVILGGARADKSSLLDHWVFSPRGNVRFGLARSLNLRLGVSTGFRPPQIFDEDLHVAAVNGEAMMVRVADGLKEESSRSFTAALDYVGHLRGGPFQLGTNFFWTRLNDVFQLKETDNEENGNRIFERTNGPGSRFRGVEFTGSWKPFAWLAVRGGATFQQARYDQPEPVFGSLRYFRTPNRYGYAGADIDLPGKIEWLNTLDLTGSMLVPHYAGYIAADRVETSTTFHVWNVVVSRTWALSAGDKNTLRLYVRGNNLGDSFQHDFDKGPNRDSVYMYGPLVPRSFVLGMTVAF